MIKSMSLSFLPLFSPVKVLCTVLVQPFCCGAVILLQTEPATTPFYIFVDRLLFRGAGTVLASDVIFDHQGVTFAEVTIFYRKAIMYQSPPKKKKSAPLNPCSYKTIEPYRLHTGACLGSYSERALRF